MRKKSPGSEINTGMRERSEGAVEVLNNATRDTLINIHGIGPLLADRIVENRPYQNAYEVVEKGILPENTFVQLRREMLDHSA
jgi:DNA uptake protein ComE-like DNA-binding protein